MPNNNWKKKRNVDSINPLEKHYYIFCEGTKTEPNYFNAIKNKIESKAIYRNSVFVKIEGVGEGTTKILEYAKKYVKENQITNSEIWIVYDKDEFTNDSFNSVAIQAARLNDNDENVEYKVAWSNQCIEYWFVLHFDYYTSNNDRKYYISYLNKKFSDLKIGKYKKNDDNIFEILEKYGDAQKAIKYAQKQLDEKIEESDANKVPATKVHMLYQELKKYF